MTPTIYAPEFGNTEIYHQLRDAHDIRGVCGKQVDSSVDETRQGVVENVPEGANPCEECYQILFEEAQETDGQSGEHQAADGEGTPGTDGETDLGTGEATAGTDPDVSEEPTTRRTSRSATPVEGGE